MMVRAPSLRLVPNGLMTDRPTCGPERRSRTQDCHSFATADGARPRRLADFAKEAQHQTAEGDNAMKTKMIARLPWQAAVVVLCLVAACGGNGPSGPSGFGGGGGGGAGGGGQPGGGGNGVGGPGNGNANAGGDPEGLGSPLHVPDDKGGQGVTGHSASEYVDQLLRDIRNECPSHDLCLKVVLLPDPVQDCITGVYPKPGSPVTMGATIAVRSGPLSACQGSGSSPSPDVTASPQGSAQASVGSSP